MYSSHAADHEMQKKKKKTQTAMKKKKILTVWVVSKKKRLVFCSCASSSRCSGLIYSGWIEAELCLSTKDSKPIKTLITTKMRNVMETKLEYSNLHKPGYRTSTLPHDNSKDQTITLG